MNIEDRVWKLAAAVVDGEMDPKIASAELTSIMKARGGHIDALIGVRLVEFLLAFAGDLQREIAKDLPS